MFQFVKSEKEGEMYYVEQSTDLDADARELKGYVLKEEGHKICTYPVFDEMEVYSKPWGGKEFEYFHLGNKKEGLDILRVLRLESAKCGDTNNYSLIDVVDENYFGTHAKIVPVPKKEWERYREKCYEAKIIKSSLDGLLSAHLLTANINISEDNAEMVGYDMYWLSQRLFEFHDEEFYDENFKLLLIGNIPNDMQHIVDLFCKGAGRARKEFQKDQQQ